MSNKFKHGDLVYWCHISQGKADICFGIIDEVYYGVIAVDILVPKDCRAFEGVPIKDWTPDGRVHKLPKNWDCDTKLFNYETTHNWDENDEVFLHNKLKNIKTKDKDEILEAYNNGYLVKSSDNCHCIIEEYIDKGTWVLRKKHSEYVGYNLIYPNIDRISIDTHKIYSTYSEALSEKTAYETEFERIKNLSDFDWSMEQINNTLDRWAAFYSIANEQKKLVFDFITNLPNLEDIEVRIYSGNIQWKYWKRKNWNNIEV